jgi:D-sedoheptulose 7-phosphate isomerase
MNFKTYFQESAETKLKFIQENEEKLKKITEIIINALKS